MNIKEQLKIIKNLKSNYLQIIDEQLLKKRIKNIKKQNNAIIVVPLKGQYGMDIKDLIPRAIELKNLGLTVEINVNGIILTNEEIIEVERTLNCYHEKTNRPTREIKEEKYNLIFEEKVEQEAYKRDLTKVKYEKYLSKLKLNNPEEILLFIKGYPYLNENQILPHLKNIPTYEQLQDEIVKQRIKLDPTITVEEFIKTYPKNIVEQYLLIRTKESFETFYFLDSRICCWLELYTTEKKLINKEISLQSKIFKNNIQYSEQYLRKKKRHLQNKISPTIAGSGTKSDPFLIVTVEDFQEITEILYRAGGDLRLLHFKLLRDIDFSDPYCYEFETSTIKEYELPIGAKYNIPFQGFFDGNYHTISNLKIKNISENNKKQRKRTAIFDHIANATIYNLNLSNVKVEGKREIGILAGTAFSSNIYNCKIENSKIKITKPSIYSLENRSIGKLVGSELLCEFSDNETDVKIIDLESKELSQKNKKLIRKKSDHNDN